MTTPANWYPDPDDANGLRYWDGSTWTEHRSPATTPAQYPDDPTPFGGPPSEPSGGSNKKLYGILGAVAAVVLVAALVLVYFFVIKDDDTKTTAASTTSSTTTTTTTSTTTSTTTTSEAATQPSGETIDEYIAANNIVETTTAPGQDGAPLVNLPVPDGWELTTEDLPSGAYGAIIYSGPDAAPDLAPVIFANLSKLDGPVDPAAILSRAPNDLLRKDGFQPSDQGNPGQLGGFDAFEFTGSADLDGTPAFIAQKTVVITTGNGVYLLQLNALSTLEQADKLGAAVGQIDNETTIQ